MRERWARALALAIGASVVVLALAVARLRNPPAPPAEPTAQHTDAAMARGRAVYLARGCPRCHAIGGEGNPRSPLDGVGSRRSAAEIRDRVLAADAVRAALPPRAVAGKRSYAELPPEDLDALVAYLSSLAD